MSNLLPAREQKAFTLGLHIILVPSGSRRPPRSDTRLPTCGPRTGRGRHSVVAVVNTSNGPISPRRGAQRDGPCGDLA